jgi:universal stress protein A
MGYKHILVAVDTSDEAEQVLSAAADLLDGTDTAISMISVIKPLANFYADLFTMLGDRESIEVQAVERAKNLLEELAKRQAINIHSIDVMIGTPAAEIRQLAQAKRADLIVMGTHSQHGLGLALGSTANAVLHGAPCSVLAVKIQNQDREL